MFRKERNTALPCAASLHPLNPRLTAQRRPKWKPTYDCNDIYNSAGSRRTSTPDALMACAMAAAAAAPAPAAMVHPALNCIHSGINATFRIAFRPLLMYAGRARSGFTPALRDQVFKRFRGLETETCPFANLPEGKGGRWGEGLTAEKMKECRWLKPALVGEFEFVEWTPDGHLRHSRFVGMHEGIDIWKVAREPRLGR